MLNLNTPVRQQNELQEPEDQNQETALTPQDYEDVVTDLWRTGNRHDLLNLEMLESQSFLRRDHVIVDSMSNINLTTDPSELGLGQLPVDEPVVSLLGEILEHAAVKQVKRTRESSSSSFDSELDNPPSDYPQKQTPKQSKVSPNFTTRFKSYKEATQFKENFFKIFQASMDRNLLPQMSFDIKESLMTVCFHITPPSTPRRQSTSTSTPKDTIIPINQEQSEPSPAFSNRLESVKTQSNFKNKFCYDDPHWSKVLRCSQREVWTMMEPSWSRYAGQVAHTDDSQTKTQ